MVVNKGILLCSSVVVDLLEYIIEDLSYDNDLSLVYLKKAKFKI